MNELWLSAISIWDAHLLIEKKRLPILEDPGDWLRDSLRLLSIREAPVTFRIATRSRTVKLPHDDPADRFIAATAAELKMSLLTADTNLLECRDIVCR